MISSKVLIILAVGTRRRRGWRSADEMTRAATPFGDAGHDYRGIAKLSRARYSGVSVIIIRSVLPPVPLLSLQSSRERGRYPL